MGTMIRTGGRRRRLVWWNMVRASGFETVEGWKLFQRPKNLAACRGFAKGVKEK